MSDREKFHKLLVSIFSPPILNLATFADADYFLCIFFTSAVQMMIIMMIMMMMVFFPGGRNKIFQILCTKLFKLKDFIIIQMNQKIFRPKNQFNNHIEIKSSQK